MEQPTPRVALGQALRGVARAGDRDRRDASRQFREQPRLQCALVRDVRLATFRGECHRAGEADVRALHARLADLEGELAQCMQRWEELETRAGV